MPPFGISLVNEDVMIRKIRLIAKNIFPLDDKELSFNLSESPKSNCPELSIAQTAHQSQQKKRRKIFDKLDYKYRMYSKSPEQRTDSPKVYRGSPLINRINRSVYDQVRTRTESSQFYSQKYRSLNHQARYQVWYDFLQREKDWQEQRDSSRKRKQIEQKAIYDKKLYQLVHSPEIMPSNQLSVQYCINRLKVQTEKLRVKILGNGDAHELHFQENTGRRMGRTMTTARKY